MEQELRDILDEFGGRFYVNAQGKHCFRVTDKNKFALEIVKLCNLYIVRKRALNRLFRVIENMIYGAIGFLLAAMTHGMFF